MALRFIHLAAILLVCLPSAAQTGEWQTLTGWQEVAFRGDGAAVVNEGVIALPPGAPFTGVHRTGPFPSSGYEVRFEAQREKGNDFFASFTFPVKESFATLVTGGWGGDIVGISSIDGWDAADNETRTYFNFENGRWYGFRLRVTDDRLQAWIDEKPVIDVVITGRRIDLRPGEAKLTTPVGFMSYNSAGRIRKVEYRALKQPAPAR
ncbi:MAG: DUF1080 domain-containing protein [Acidobacteria bacterium]|nr:DUF1080 domain-containing protein [Acidobacteriota bacterium]